MSDRRFGVLLVTAFAAPLFALTGCGQETSADTAASSSAATTAPMADMTIDEYLRQHGVTGLRQTAADLTGKGLQISLYQPPNWFIDRNNQVPNTFAVMTNSLAADEKFVPNAVVIVTKLTGDFDPAEAITRGPTDTQRYPGFVQQAVEVTTVDGLPTSTVTGTFPSDGKSLRVTNRYAIATVGALHYAVLLTVTTTAAQADSLQSDVTALVDGLTITEAS